MKQVTFLNKTWQIAGIRTAEQVLAEFPDPRMGLLMQQNNLELVLLKAVESSTIELMVARIYQRPTETVAFRDQQGTLLDPDSFVLS